MPDVHVVPQDDGRIVQHDHAAEPISTHGTREGAAAAARKYAEHRSDVDEIRIRDEDSAMPVGAGEPGALGTSGP